MNGNELSLFHNASCMIKLKTQSQKKDYLSLVKFLDFGKTTNIRTGVYVLQS